MVLTKRCRNCGIEYPATREYFHGKKPNKDQLNNWCKSCRREKSRRYRADNYEEVQERKRKYYEANREAILEAKRQNYWANRDTYLNHNKQRRRKNPDKVKEYNGQYYKAHRSRVQEGSQRWRAANRSRVQENSRKYYLANQGKAKEYSRKYYHENREAARDIARRWYANNPEKSLLLIQRRRARKQALPDTLTVEQWLKALVYWENCCAYCGKHVEKLTLDHYIPLISSDCPGTVATNALPACRNCNSSKKNKEAFVWLVFRFGEARAHEIQLHILAYFDTIWAEEGED